MVSDYKKDLFRRISDRQTPDCKHPVWFESGAIVTDSRIASMLVSASQLVPDRHVEHLLNVKTRFHCPQAIFSVESHCRMHFF